MSVSAFLSADNSTGDIGSSNGIGGTVLSQQPSPPRPTPLPPPPLPPFHAAPDSSVAAVGAAAGAARQVGGRKSTQHNPPASMWNKHKEAIRDLYVVKNWTCERTMKQMETVHGFIASKRMYKAKFREWKFRKIIRPPLARKILKAAEHRGDKPTEAVVDDAVIPMGRVRESYERYSAQGGSHLSDAPTPANLPVFYLRTPGNTTSPAGQMQSPVASRHFRSPAVAPAEEAGKSDVAQAWTPSCVADCLVPAQDSSVLRTDWRGMSLTQLRQLKWDAARFDAEGRTEEAEGLFASAIAGFRHLLSETHDLTVKAAYQLAAFYANHDRMADADKVLHWVSENHIEKWGVGNEQTLAHYLRVVLLLHTWNRDEHAEVLVFRITEALQDKDYDGQSAPRIPGNHEAHIQGAVDDLDEESVEQIFAESEDESRVDTQLRIADLWITSRSASMQQILPRLIHHCDRYPERLAVQGLQARCKLVQLHIMHGNNDEASQALLEARRALAQMMPKQPEDASIPQTLLSVARNLAFLHLDNDEETNCDRVLSWMAERLERQAGTGIVTQEPTDLVAVGFLTQTALEYQRRSGWKGAKPWIEWAYGISSRALGPRHSKTQTLEAALGHEHYEQLGGDLAMKLFTPGLGDITLEII
ncbi:hypothetical protein DL768_008751 [Monosporascus sp. mg162]|nr:hypothetical protein DL768_008751 [Monosporascus sp. mg162]